MGRLGARLEPGARATAGRGEGRRRLPARDRDDLKTAADRGEGTVTLGGELCHVAPCTLVADPQAFRSFVDRSSAGCPLSGFLVPHAGELRPELTPGLLDRLARSVRAIFVGAYDGTGFVAWLPG